MNTRYADIDPEVMFDFCLVHSRNCISVNSLLYTIGGQNSKYEFFKDNELANDVYDKATQDLAELGMEKNILWFDIKEEGNVKAVVAVLFYKRTKLQHPRLVLVGAIKVTYLEESKPPSQCHTFVRAFHLPCKNNSNYITFFNLNDYAYLVKNLQGT